MVVASVWSILNIPIMCCFSTVLVLHPRPHKVLAMYQVSPSPLAPSVYTMVTQRTSKSFNVSRSVRARGSSTPYPTFEQVYACSNKVNHRETFSDLNVRDFIGSYKRIARCRLAELDMTDAKWELYKRGVQAFDDKVEVPPIVEACMGYT